MPALYSHTTRATGTILTATIYNGDHQNHIDNGVPAQLDDYSVNVAQMQTTTDPGDAGSESLALSLAGEIERLRFAIKEMKGTTYWYETRPMWERISDTVPTAGNTVSIAIPTGYKLFRLHIINVQASAGGANNELFFRVVQNGSVVSGATEYYQSAVYWNSAAGTIAMNLASFISMATNGTSIGEGTEGTIYFNEAPALRRLKIWGETRSVNNAGSRTIMIHGSEVLTSTFRCDNINFGWVGGTTFAVEGRFILEGMR